MPTIKNVGKKVRMVADRILQPGESKSVTAKQAERFVGDADFEITGLAPDPTPLSASQTSPQMREEHPNLEGEEQEEKPVVKKRRGKKR